MGVLLSPHSPEGAGTATGVRVGKEVPVLEEEGSSEGPGSCQTVGYGNPLAAVTQSLFLFCLSPLQVTAQPQPSLEGRELGRPLPSTP